VTGKLKWMVFGKQNSLLLDKNNCWIYTFQKSINEGGGNGRNSSVFGYSKIKENGLQETTSCEAA
jgi:hypothetical protein